MSAAVLRQDRKDLLFQLRLRAAVLAFGEKGHRALVLPDGEQVEFMAQVHPDQRRTELHAMRERLHQVQAEAATLRRAIRKLELSNA